MIGSEICQQKAGIDYSRLYKDKEAIKKKKTSHDGWIIFGRSSRIGPSNMSFLLAHVPFNQFFEVWRTGEKLGFN